jgi:hypothetical protein
VVGFRKGVGGEGKLESEMLVSVGSQSIVRFNCLFVLEVTEGYVEVGESGHLEFSD